MNVLFVFIEWTVKYRAVRPELVEGHSQGIDKPSPTGIGMTGQLI